MNHLKLVGIALFLAAPLACSYDNREVESPEPPSADPIAPSDSNLAGSSNPAQGIPQTDTNTPSDSSAPLDPGSTGGTSGNVGLGGNSSR